MNQHLIKNPLFLFLRCLQGLAFLGFGLFFIAFVQHSSLHISYSWATDYVEMPEIGRAWALSQGRGIYTSWEQAPFHEANYTPLYTVINAIIVFFTGPTPFGGRLLSFLFVLATAGVLTGIVRQAGGGRWLSVWAGLLYCSSHMVWMWASLVRVDNLAVLLNLMAIWVFMKKWQEEKSKSGLYICIALLIAAAYTRQTMVASAVAIFGCLLMENRRLGLKMLGLYAGIGLTLLALLSLLTDGWAWHHLISANVNEYEWSSLAFFYGRCWALYHWILPIAAFGCWALWRKYPLIPIYVVVAGLVSLTIGKIGASLNYLLEFWAGLCLLCAFGLCKLEQMAFAAAEKWKKAMGLACWLLMLIGWQQIFHVPWQRMHKPNGGMQAMALEEWNPLAAMVIRLPLWYLDPFGVSGMDAIRRSVKDFSSVPAPWEAQMMATIEESLEGIQGPILSEDMNFTLSLGKEIWIQSFEFTQLARQGIWDIGKWHQSIKERQFGALVLMFDLDESIEGKASIQRFSPQTIELLQAHYQQRKPNFRLGPYRVYIPKEGE